MLADSCGGDRCYFRDIYVIGNYHVFTTVYPTILSTMPPTYFPTKMDETTNMNNYITLKISNIVFYIIIFFLYVVY